MKLNMGLNMGLNKGLNKGLMKIESYSFWVGYATGGMVTVIIVAIVNLI